MKEYAPGTATVGTQVWKYRMRDMFDDFAAADYEDGTTTDMLKRFNDIRNIYARAGYRIENFKTEHSKVRDDKTGRRFTQTRMSFGVFDVPLKCLKGKKAKELIVYIWINN